MSSHISLFLIYSWLCSPLLIVETKITLHDDKWLITDLNSFRPEGCSREIKEMEITHALHPTVKISQYLCWSRTRGSDGVPTAATVLLTNSCQRFCRIKAVSTWAWAAASSLLFPPLKGHKSNSPEAAKVDNTLVLALLLTVVVGSSWWKEKKLMFLLLSDYLVKS